MTRYTTRDESPRRGTGPAPPARPSTHDHLLDLQRLAGNGATATAIRSGAAPLTVQRVAKIRPPGRRAATDLDLLDDDQVSGLVQELEGTPLGFTIVYDDSENAAGLLARAKKKLAARQQVTASFNVRGRAVAGSGIVVFTDVPAVRDHALSLDLPVYPFGAEAPVRDVHPGLFTGTVTILDQPSLKTRCYGHPTALRGPRANAAADGGKVPSLAGKDTHQTAKLSVGGPCRRGDETKTRDAAMGGMSALNYARAVKVPGAEDHTWEWLHLVGSAIGGGNVLGNLVAGTYDANTLMIPLEQTVVEYSRRPDVTPQNPMTVWAEASLWKQTWVAESITLHLEHGGRHIHLGPVKTETKRLTQFEFDFYRLIFQLMAGNA